MLREGDAAGVAAALRPGARGYVLLSCALVMLDCVLCCVVRVVSSSHDAGCGNVSSLSDRSDEAAEF